MKRFNIIVPSILSSIFGPFGYLYYNWSLFWATVLGAAIMSVNYVTLHITLILFFTGYISDGILYDGIFYHILPIGMLIIYNIRLCRIATISINTFEDYLVHTEKYQDYKNLTYRECKYLTYRECKSYCSKTVFFESLSISLYIFTAVFYISIVSRLVIAGTFVMHLLTFSVFIGAVLLIPFFLAKYFSNKSKKLFKGLPVAITMSADTTTKVGVLS